MPTAPPMPPVVMRNLETIPGVSVVIADTETTGLVMPYLPGGRRAWEYCLYRLDPDGHEEWLHFFVDLGDIVIDPGDAELLKTLNTFGRFSERHPQMNPSAPGTVVREREAARLVYEFFHPIPPGPAGKGQDRNRPRPMRKPWLLGAVATFEEQQFLDLLRRHGFIADGDGPWDYHILCVEVYAAGRLRTRPPWNAKKLTRRFGVDPDRFDAHTAKGDVEWAIALFMATLKPFWARWAARLWLALKGAYKTLTAPRRRRAA